MSKSPPSGFRCSATSVLDEVTGIRPPRCWFDATVSGDRVGPAPLRCGERVRAGVEKYAGLRHRRVRAQMAARRALGMFP